ncbi:winged helix DNA-binding protein [Parvibaculum sp.]|uniref:winged helix DNA-binding protein n=1 Tax=Parvibaculum sp. TaxID=2024848 RepID=UPI002D7F971C|nr:winged helix DNA-binding protein [Parvibaculum sp.]
MPVQALITEPPSLIARQGGSLPQSAPASAAASALAEEPTLTRHRARMLLDLYNARMKFFPTGLFADPAWDMLLDLTHARLAGKRVSVSSLCIAAHVPATTALRRIGDLVASGLAVRIKDENDGRRVFVELTEDGFERMGRYLEAVLKSMSADTSVPLKRA